MFTSGNQTQNRVVFTSGLCLYLVNKWRKHSCLHLVIRGRNSVCSHDQTIILPKIKPFQLSLLMICQNCKINMYFCLVTRHELKGFLCLVTRLESECFLHPVIRFEEDPFLCLVSKCALFLCLVTRH